MTDEKEAFTCHCEERSDVAIPVVAGEDSEIATLRSQ
jgi:hypothetical protein